MTVSTKDRILAVTEDLFGQHGFSATTLRDVTDRAGVNLASVNYHFGSKEALFMEMLRRRIEPINRKRIELLDEALRRSGGAPLSLEAIWDAILRPLGEAVTTTDGFDEKFLRLISQSLVERNEFFETAHQQFFTEFKERFSPELARSLPKMDPQEMTWRVYFSFSAMLGAIIQHQKIGRWFPFLENRGNVDNMIDRLINFIVAGLTNSRVGEVPNREEAEVRS